MFDKDFKDSLVSFDGPNGTLVEVSAMEIAGCYGLPVTPKEERSKKGGIGIFCLPRLEKLKWLTLP